MKYTQTRALSQRAFSLFKDGSRLYGFAKPTAPHQRKILRGECASVAVFLHIKHYRTTRGSSQSVYQRLSLGQRSIQPSMRQSSRSKRSSSIQHLICLVVIFSLLVHSLRKHPRHLSHGGDDMRVLASLGTDQRMHRHTLVERTIP